MVLVEPYSTKCGHTFCRKCILEAYSAVMDNSNESTSVRENSSNETRLPLFRCPVDRHPLPNPKDLQPAPFLISSLVNDLVVACPFANRGCNWEDKRWLVSKHVSQDCPFVNVKCSGLRSDGKTCEDIALRGEVLDEIKKARLAAVTAKTTRSNSLLNNTLADARSISRSASGVGGQSTLAESSALEYPVPSDDTSSVELKDYTKLHDSESAEATLNGLVCQTPPSPRQRGSSITRVLYKCVHEQKELQKNTTSVQCECGESVDTDDVERHISEECMAVSVICQDCQQTMARPLLTHHSREECTAGIVFCPAQEYGCDWSGKRSDQQLIADHQAACILIKLIPVLSKQTKRIESLEHDNQALRLCVERLTSITNDETSTITDSTAASRTNSSTTSFTDSDLLHMFMECERLRRDVDHLNSTSSDMYLKQGMLMMRENIRLSEEINVLRSGFTSLRHQLHFLLTERRSWASHYYHGSSDSHIPPQPAPPERPSQRSLGDLLRDVKL
ncbi:hypothetical protein AWJ20_1855 [Sugiyamaella lignohabitans]|uniref:TRAF-type domain-containing protein n=1 Tax=Sugiyamaella lignohabitans TaxID=796027 RepID=A0A167E2A4_9ASCO|nr:uncharacterized protein AWJ20_1855 [Sugiyamaella lignohabitans]ANB13559.1 hypothetical protein AWJ20_1855 [Sugiyamaella lignohabitans]